GSIGTAFLPIIMDVSKWLQDAAHWVQNLDSSTMRSIGRFAAWTVGILGAGYAVLKLVSVVGALQKALLLLSMNPATAWLVAIGAAVAAADAAFGVFSSMADQVKQSQMTSS